MLFLVLFMDLLGKLRFVRRDRFAVDFGSLFFFVVLFLGFLFIELRAADQCIGVSASLRLFVLCFH
jgi:hypothetical protein